MARHMVVGATGSPSAQMAQMALWEEMGRRKSQGKTSGRINNQQRTAMARALERAGQGKREDIGLERGTPPVRPGQRAAQQRAAEEGARITQDLTYSGQQSIAPPGSDYSDLYTSDLYTPGAPPPRQTATPRLEPPPRQTATPRLEPPPRQTATPRLEPPPRQTATPRLEPPPRQTATPRLEPPPTPDEVFFGGTRQGAPTPPPTPDEVFYNRQRRFGGPPKPTPPPTADEAFFKATRQGAPTPPPTPDEVFFGGTRQGGAAELPAEEARQFDPAARLAGPESKALTTIAAPTEYDFKTPEDKQEFGLQEATTREGELRSAIESRLLSGIGGDEGDPETVALRAEFELNRQKEQRQLVEQMQRYGVIGGEGASAGASADIFGEFAGQTNLGRLQLEALAQQSGGRALERAMEYQRGQEGIGLEEGRLTGRLRGAQTLEAQQMASRQGLDRGALDLQREETQARLGLAGRGTDIEQARAEEGFLRSRQEREEGRALFGERVGERERFAVEAEVARGALKEESEARAERMGLARGELTGEIEGAETVGAKALAEETAARKQRAGLAKEEMYGVDPSDPWGRETIAAKELTEQRRARGVQEEMERGRLALAEEEMYGGDPSDPWKRETLRAREMAESRRLATAGLTGEMEGGGLTLGAKALAEETSARQQRARLAEEEMYGGDPSDPWKRETVAARALTSEEAARSERMELARAEMMGETAKGDRTFAAIEAEKRRDLAQAELLGEMPGPGGLGRETLAARQGRESRELAEAGLEEQTAARQQRARLAEEEMYGGDPSDPWKRETVAARALTEESQARGERMDIAREELYGGRDFDGGVAGQATMAAREAKERRTLAEAELTGTFDEQQTMAAQALEEDKRQAQVREGLAAEELYGGDPSDPWKRETMAAKTLAEQRLARQERTRLAEGELTGMVGGEETLGSQALEEQVTARQQRARMAEEEMYGGEGMVAGRPGRETLQRQLAEADITGRYDGDATMRREALEAEITGRYGEVDEEGIKADTFAARTQKRREDMDALARSLAVKEAQAATDNVTLRQEMAQIQEAIQAQIQDPSTRRMARGATMFQTRPKQAMVDYAMELERKSSKDPTSLTEEELDYLWMYEQNAGIFGTDY